MKNPPSARKKLLLLAVNFLIVFTVYQLLLSLEGVFGLAVTVAYLLICAALCVAYFIVNRGFGKPDGDPSLLPAAWSAAEKCAYIEDAARRHERAKGILLWLLPFVATILIDITFLFLLSPLLEMLR